MCLGFGPGRGAEDAVAITAIGVTRGDLHHFLQQTIIEGCGVEAELDETAVITYCQQTLPKFKTPVRVVAIDEFPVTRSANGTKIQRTKLRKMAEDLLSSR